MNQPHAVAPGWRRTLIAQIAILVRLRENTSIADVRDTLQHEACHDFVDWQETEEHGPMFQECMNRFQEGP